MDAAPIRLVQVDRVLLELGRQAGVSVVETDHESAASGKALAEAAVPGEQLSAEPGDQQDGRVGRLTERLVLEGGAARKECLWHPDPFVRIEDRTGRRSVIPNEFPSTGLRSRRRVQSRQRPSTARERRLVGLRDQTDSPGLLPAQLDRYQQRTGPMNEELPTGLNRHRRTDEFDPPRCREGYSGPIRSVGMCGESFAFVPGRSGSSGKARRVQKPPWSSRLATESRFHLRCPTGSSPDQIPDSLSSSTADRSRSSTRR